MMTRVLNFLIVLWLVVPASGAFAQLLLGAAPGATPGLKPAEARRLAETLADALDQQVAVRLFDQREQIGQWLNQHAMLDLGILDAAYLAEHPGEFLILGPTDKSGRLLVVARQGVTGDMPQRVAALLDRGGKVRSPQRLPGVGEAARPAATTAEPSARPVAAPAAVADQLLLGVTKSPEGSAYTQVEADRLAVLVSEGLGVPVRARVFDSEQSLAEWFLRYRMIDLAMIADTGRSDVLGRNYRALLRLTTPAASAGPDLVVARLDLDGERLRRISEAADSHAGVLALARPTAPQIEPPAIAPTPVPALPVAPVEEVVVAPVPPPVPEVTVEKPPAPELPFVPVPPRIVEPPAPGLTLAKTASVEQYRALGEVIDYTYVVMNTGNVTLTGVQVSDPPVEVICPGDTLAPGARLTCTGRYLVAASDLVSGSVATTATATSAQTEPASASVTVAAKILLPASIGPQDTGPEWPAPVAPTVVAAPALPPVPVIAPRPPAAVAAAPPAVTAQEKPLDEKTAVVAPASSPPPVEAIPADMPSVPVEAAPVEPTAIATPPVVAEPLAALPPPVAALEPTLPPAEESARNVSARPAPTQVAKELPATTPVEAVASVPVTAPADGEATVPVTTTAVVQPVPEPVASLPFVPTPPLVIEEPARSMAAAEAAAVPPEGDPALQPEPLIQTASIERLEPVTVEPSPRGTSVPAVADLPPVAEAPLTLAGTAAVPDVISQPDLPQELRPPGLPTPRPARLAKASPPAEEPLLLAKLPETLARTPKPPPLLPAPDPEPGVVYVVPFITLMVPTVVQERVFDQFVDTLNQRGARQPLKFVILKQGFDKTDRSWLGARKYVLGEVFGYVEESGCCSTDIRTRVRMTYFRSHQEEPVLKYEYPARAFFEHDRSTLDVERIKFADQIAGVLVEELFKALQP